MGRRYCVDGQGSNDDTTHAAILGLTSATTIKPKIYDLIIGSDAVAADNAVELVLQRYTAAGSGDDITPRPLDPDDPAALAAAKENHTADPTFTDDLVLLQIGMNQRATFRWVAAPGGEIVLPAATANGVGLQTINLSASPYNTNVTMHYEE